MATYTDQERETIRSGAFGAMYLVSNAEPGFIDMMKESFAGSEAFEHASPELRNVLKSGGLPQIPGGNASDVEDGILNALAETTAILQSKGDEELDGFRDAVSNAVDSVAETAGGGISDREAVAVEKVKAAIGL